MFGQTERLAPSDKKLYSLRDATCTVESLPLIVSSILSKKYAEDLNGLVLDVKYGSGAFLKDFKNSRKLAVALKATARRLGIKCVAILTNMEEPLGNAIGNAVEMEQSIRILKGEGGPEDFMEVLEVLSGWMIYLGKKAKSVDDGINKARKAVESGAALDKMREIIKWQKGDPRVLDNPEKFLPRSKSFSVVKAAKSGYIKKLDARILGRAAIVLPMQSFLADTIRPIPMSKAVTPALATSMPTHVLLTRAAAIIICNRRQADGTRTAKPGL